MAWASLAQLGHNSCSYVDFQFSRPFMTSAGVAGFENIQLIFAPALKQTRPPAGEVQLGKGNMYSHR